MHAKRLKKKKKAYWFVLIKKKEKERRQASGGKKSIPDMHAPTAAGPIAVDWIAGTVPLSNVSKALNNASKASMPFASPQQHASLLCNSTN